jgi:hypothetical protein
MTPSSIDFIAYGIGLTLAIFVAAWLDRIAMERARLKDVDRDEAVETTHDTGGGPVGCYGTEPVSRG